MLMLLLYTYSFRSHFSVVEDVLFTEVKEQEARSKDAKGETFFENKENVRQQRSGG